MISESGEKESLLLDPPLETWKRVERDYRTK